MVLVKIYISCGVKRRKERSIEREVIRLTIRGAPAYASNTTAWNCRA